MANSYEIGEGIRLSAVFTKNAIATNPAAVTFTFKAPTDEAAETYTYGTDVELVRDSTGNYHVDLIPDEEGVWEYRWTGIGTVDTAGGGSFYVKKSNI